MNGIINVHKEAGWTSHDVVARLRRILGVRRIGHTGTLDPAATGVLPVCVGRSTVLADTIAEGEKVYETVLLLGVRTDTYDLEGKILEEREVTCTADEAATCVKSFIGEQEQLPPMYSAIKVGGKKLYELARKGIEVERKPRHIMVFDIAVKETALPRIRLEITCSKGTYIRSLCSDIGEKLGCGGCMAELIRTRVGIFRISDARKIGEIQAAAEAGDLAGILTGPDRYFPGFPAVRTKPEADRMAYNGNSIRVEDLLTEDYLTEDVLTEDIRTEDYLTEDVLTEDIRTEDFLTERGPAGRMRLYDSSGAFVGLFDRENDKIRPYKMLYDTDPEK